MKDKSMTRLHFSIAAGLAFALVLAVVSTPSLQAQDSKPTIAKSIYDLSAKSWDGKVVKLSSFKGKAIVFVNVASKCGFTGQYKGLEALYKKYEEKGLVVLAFPCNQFGGQEPGSNKEIREFCTSKFNVSFPLMEKVDVNGTKQSAVFKWLTSQPDSKGKVRWNFEKFVVDRNGKFIGRFSSPIKPDSKSLKTAVEKALSAKS